MYGKVVTEAGGSCRQSSCSVRLKRLRNTCRSNPHKHSSWRRVGCKNAIRHRLFPAQHLKRLPQLPTHPSVATLQQEVMLPRAMQRDRCASRSTNRNVLGCQGRSVRWSYARCVGCTDYSERVPAEELFPPDQNESNLPSPAFDASLAAATCPSPESATANSIIL